MAQSTNDVIPTAGKLTVLDLLKPLDKSLSLLTEALYDKAEEFDPIVKIGRTQLEDAVPMRLGQTFHSYATMISRDRDRLTKSPHGNVSRKHGFNRYRHSNQYVPVLFR